jgi:hypothetical protein
MQAPSGRRNGMYIQALPARQHRDANLPLKQWTKPA